MHSYIISGGPGAGKTTLLQALHQKGFATSEEVSRQLIIQEVSKGNNCLPWVNLPCFALKVLKRMMQDYEHAQSYSGTTFFDRGIPDIISYLEAANLPVDEVYQQAVQQHRYNRVVFLAPPWQEIYVNDSERWQTFEEAVTLHNAIKATYQSLQYTILELPKATVAERADFIVSHL
ncbi:AAA family ATPase [Pontibacter sp. 13R65]|uniref:AAA family ATPase n=1 Tax=Pontibacter sp. 13R65 TaxID=3127458 RepID=UPI00301D7EA7